MTIALSKIIEVPAYGIYSGDNAVFFDWRERKRRKSRAIRTYRAMHWLPSEGTADTPAVSEHKKPGWLAHGRRRKNDLPDLP